MEEHELRPIFRSITDKFSDILSRVSQLEAAPYPVAGAGGAPTDAQYLTLAANATLTQERILNVTGGATVLDNGAGLTYDVTVHDAVTLAGGSDPALALVGQQLDLDLANATTGPWVELDGGNQASWIPNPAGDATQDITGHFNLSSLSYAYKIADNHALQMWNTRNSAAGHWWDADATVTGSDNALFGYYAGDTLTTGGKNLIAGAYADAPSGASYNIILGYLSGKNNATDIYATTIIGASAFNGAVGITIEDSVLIGDEAGYSAAHDITYVVAIGHDVLKPTTGTPYYSVYIGPGILNVGGSYQTFIGGDAGVGVNDDYVTLVGAFTANTGAVITGTTAMGYNAATSSSGTYNAYYGYYSGVGKTGGNNAGFGAYSLYNLGDNVSNTVALGYYAGAEYDGTGSVFIGYQVGKTDAGRDNVLYINNADSATPLIYGEFDTPSLTISGSVTIGIGAAGVDYTLTFNGEDNDGVITWLEDEDTFDMACHLRVRATTDYLEFYHDETDGYITWTDGVLYLLNTETDTDALVAIQGNGTGSGIFYIYDADNSDALTFHQINANGFINAQQGELHLQNLAYGNVILFNGVGSGQSPTLDIHGDHGGTEDTLSINVNDGIADYSHFTGTTYYTFSGSLIAGRKAGSASGEEHGVYGYINIDYTGATTTKYSGVYGYVVGSAKVGPYNGAISGGRFYADVYTSGGTIDLAAAVRAETKASQTGTISLLAGVYIASGTYADTVTLTEQHGLYIESQTVGVTNYAIYTNSGIVYFGDDVTTVGDLTIINTQPTLLLTDTTALAQDFKIYADADRLTFYNVSNVVPMWNMWSDTTDAFLYSYDQNAKIGWLSSDATDYQIIFVQNATDGAEATVGLFDTTGYFGVGSITPTWKFSVGSADDASQVGVYHDNTHAYIQWDEGNLRVKTAVTDADTKLQVLGNGAGDGNVEIYNSALTEYILMTMNGTAGFIRMAGTGPTALNIQHDTEVPVNFFASATDGESQPIRIYGWYAGAAASRRMNIEVCVDADFLATFEGTVTDFLFEGDVWLKDNNALQLGTGVDASFYYDGTDMKLVTDLVAASDFVLDCGTNKTLELAEVVYDDQQVSLGQIRLGSSSPTWTPYKSSEVLAFDKAQDNLIYFIIQFSHRAKQGADFEFHIHNTVPDNNTGDVRWVLTVSFADIGGTFPGATTYTAVQSILANSLDDHLYFEVSGNIGSTSGVSGIALCSLMREGTHASDTYNNDVYVLAIDSHFAIDTMGSRQEATK